MRIRLGLLLVIAACHREAKPSLHAEPVTRGRITEVVSATGEVSAVVTVTVGSQISGAISKLYGDWNSRVTAGQVLAEIDPRLFQVAHARAQAGLSAAQADERKARVALADAKLNAGRLANLFDKRLIARAELDTAASNRDGAEAALVGAAARVEQAKADLEAAVTNLALCKIRSPIDGVVISRSIDVGQTVAASLQAPVLFLIANDLSRMQVLANVDEADVGKVKEGLTAQFTVDAFPGETFRGRIAEVRQAPSAIQGVVTYAAVIDAPNPERKLRQGMTANISIVTNARDKALRLPNAALRYHPQESKAVRAAGTVVANAWADEAPVGQEGAEAATPGQRKMTAWKLEGKKPVKVQVVLGISDGHHSEVIKGLDEGDLVILGDAAKEPQGAKRGLF
jgi:HlyD family secretion protein